MAYIGEFCDEGKVSIDLLSTDTELDDLEKYIDIPILINCEKERIPEKIVFDTKGFKKITLYLYIRRI